MIRFVLNGVNRTHSGDPELSLLNYLRGIEGLISPKDGCSPQAACGCCTVELDQKAVLSCITPMRKVDGTRVITTEGMEDLVQRAFVSAFAEKGAVQCGFCIPGIVMRAKTLIEQNPHPSRQEIAQALTNHICRCTGYVKIIDAIETAAEAIRERRFLELPSTNGKIGKRHPKYEAEKLVLGHRPYVCDLTAPGMQFAALKFSDHPRARVLSIDITEAAALDGVCRVFTAKDIPGRRNVGLIVADWPLMIAAGETTNYIGDVLAGVVAETEEIARQAVALIRVEYEILEPVTDVHAALAATSPVVHGDTNLLDRCVVNRGDAGSALKNAPFTVSRTFRTQTIEHGYMEPEACLAKPWQHDGVQVFSQSQGVYEDQRQISDLLGLDKEKINVTLVPNGGGFGGKEDLSVQGHAALFAFLLKKPVKLTLNREESIRMHPKRHPLELEYSVGCDANGYLTAVKARIIGDTGAYASVGMKVLERAAGHSTGAYNVPNVDVISSTVYTNNIPNGAMRGFGANQANFAMESCIDELCEMGGFNRWQFRYQNALKDGDPTATGQILEGGVGVRKTLEAVKEKFESAKYAGIACGIKNTGIGNGMPDASTVKIVIDEPDQVTIHHGWCEMGQGVHTMAVQTLCEETGLDPAIIRVQVETREQTPAGMTTASRATSLLGNAIIDACKTLKADLKNIPLAELTGRVYRGEWVCDWTTKPGKATDKIITHYSYSYATQVVTLDEHGKLDTVYAAHDAGKIMNPMLFEGQIEGSVHMGLGYALSEELVYENGHPKSYKLRDCGILRAKQMPKVEVIGVEVSDPLGPCSTVNAATHCRCGITRFTKVGGAR
jgi:aldehyde oxidoreductase